MKLISDKAIGIVYGLCILFIVIFSIYSYRTPYPKNGFMNDSFSVLDTGWNYQAADGNTAERIVLPAYLHASVGEKTVISRLLPVEQYRGSKLFIKSAHEDVKVVIGDETVYEYHYASGQRINRKFAPSLWLCVPIAAGDAGKKITITFTTLQNDGSPTIQKIYLGEKTAILYYLVRQSWVSLLMSAAMISLGLVLLFYFMFIRKKDDWASGYHYMGLYILSTGCWFLSQSEVRQILFNNVLYVRNLEFFSLMMIGIPFIMTIDHIEGKRYHSMALAFCAGILATEAVITLLAFTGVFHFLQMLWVIQLTFLAAIAYAFITFALLYRQENAVFCQLIDIIIGHVILMCSGLAEVIAMFLIGTKYQGDFLSTGALIFSVIMVNSQARGYHLLQEEKQTAEARDRAKSEILTSMSHEIRTPINAVLGMDEMILRESDNEQITAYALDIQSAGRNLLAIVNDILDFSRIESGHMEITEAEYDLGSFLNDIINLFRFRAEKKGIAFEVHVSESLPSHLIGDEFRIRQVVINLLGNAVKYTNKGKVELIVLPVAGYRGGNETFSLQISVRDTGVGIREEDKARLFTKFERLDPLRNRGVEGTGLGLAISGQLVKLMHGRFEVNSEYGVGSTFTVEIPQKRCTTDQIGNFEERYRKFTAPVARYKESFRAPEAAVLVVDDNEMNLKLMQGLLKRTQVKVTFCGGGEEALRIVESQQFDLIFMDHLMPDLDGIETLHRMQQQPVNCCRNTPVIALTANAISGMKEMYLKEGFTDYLSKPIDGLLLEKMVMQYLPRRKVIEIVQDAKVQASEKPAPGSSAEAASGVVDFQLGATYCMGDHSVYLDILRIFCDSYQEKRRIIETEYEQQDWSRYQVHVHALKSTSLTIGARVLSAAARELEYAAKRYADREQPEKALEYIHTNQASMLQLYEETIAVCSNYLKTDVTGGHVQK